MKLTINLEAADLDALLDDIVDGKFDDRTIPVTANLTASAFMQLFEIVQYEKGLTELAAT